MVKYFTETNSGQEGPMYEHTKSGWGCLFGASGLLSATVAVLLACVLTLGAAAPVCATERCELIRLYFKANELRGKIEEKENAMHAHARDARDLKRWLDERAQCGSAR